MPFNLHPERIAMDKTLETLTGTDSQNRGKLITRLSLWPNAQHAFFIHHTRDFELVQKDMVRRLDAAGIKHRITKPGRFEFPEGGRLDLHCCRDFQDTRRFAGCQWQTLFIGYAPAMDERTVEILRHRLRTGNDASLPEPITMACFPRETAPPENLCPCSFPHMPHDNCDGKPYATGFQFLGEDAHRQKLPEQAQRDEAAHIAKMCEAFPVLETCRPAFLGPDRKDG